MYNMNPINNINNNKYNIASHSNIPNPSFGVGNIAGVGMNQQQNFNNNYNFGQPSNIGANHIGKIPSGIPSGKKEISNQYKFGDAKKPS